MFRARLVLLCFIVFAAAVTGHPLPVLAEEGVVFVSEVYFQASTYSARDKWVELYNPTDTPQVLADYTLLVGRKRYRFNLDRAGTGRALAPYSTYLLEDSWGDETRLLSDNGYAVDDTSGVLHWLSNVSTDPHLTLSLEYRGRVIQELHYSKTQVETWRADSPLTSLNCNLRSCTVSTASFDAAHTANPGRYLPPVAPKIPQTPAPEPVTTPEVVAVPVIDSPAPTPTPAPASKIPVNQVHTAKPASPLPLPASPQPAPVPIEVIAPVTPPEAASPISSSVTPAPKPSSVSAQLHSEQALTNSAVSTPQPLPVNTPKFLVVDLPALALTQQVDYTHLTASSAGLDFSPTPLETLQAKTLSPDLRGLSVWLLLAASGYLLEQSLRSRQTVASLPRLDNSAAAL